MENKYRTVSFNENKNSFFLIVLLYLSPILYLSSILLSNSQLFYFEKLLYLIFFVFLMVYKKFRIKKIVVIMVILCSILFLFNAFFSPYPTYVLPVYFNFIAIFLPVLLILSNEVNYSLVFEIWGKFALVFSLLLPLYIFLNQIGKIGYYEVGYVTHVNILFYAYLFSNLKQGRKIKNIILLLVNILCCFVFGSRSVLAAGVIVIILSFFSFQKERKTSYYLVAFGLSAIAIYVYKNLISLLMSLQALMNNFGFSSRNLILFIQQLNDKSDGVYLSGRDGIYPLIFAHLENTNGFPEGVGMARVLTSGEYYHAHNFILEMLLTFGIILGFILLLLLMICFLLLLLKKNKSDRIKFCVILLISFFTRSMVGTYFLQDTIFIVGFCILTQIYTSKKESNNENFTN